MQPGATLNLVLQWNDEFEQPLNDFTLALFDAADGVRLALDTDSQFPTRDSLRSAEWKNTTRDTRQVYAVIKQENLVDDLDPDASPEAPILEMLVSGTNAFGLFNTPADSIYGHPAVPGVLTVGAFHHVDSGTGYPREFSSIGPSTVIHEVFGLQTRNSLDVLGPDGVSISGRAKFGEILRDDDGNPLRNEDGSFQRGFRGTSAAAPHLAGLTALLMELAPARSAAEIFDAIRQTARDVTAVPVAVEDAWIVSAPGETTVIDVLANDLDVDRLLGGDPDRDALIITNAKLDDPASGASVRISDDGTRLEYTSPPERIPGAVWISYTMQDHEENSSESSLRVIHHVGDRPLAVADGAVVLLGESVEIPVLANDQQRSGNPLFVQSNDILSVNGGTVLFDPVTGVLTYEPPIGFEGKDTFSYLVSDGTLTDSGTVTVEVLGNLQDLVAQQQDDIVIMRPGQRVSVNLTGSDFVYGAANIDSYQCPDDPACGFLPISNIIINGGNLEFDVNPDAIFLGVETIEYFLDVPGVVTTGTLTVIVDDAGEVVSGSYEAIVSNQQEWSFPVTDNDYRIVGGVASVVDATITDTDVLSVSTEYQQLLEAMLVPDGKHVRFVPNENFERLVNYDVTSFDASWNDLVSLEDIEYTAETADGWTYTGRLVLRQGTGGKFRIGDDLSALAPIGITLSHHEILTVTADGGSSSAGPFQIRITDDDPNTGPRGVEGTIDVTNGTVHVDIRRFTGGIGDYFTLAGENGTIAFGPDIPPGSPSFAVDPLKLGVNLPGLPEVALTANDLKVYSDGTITIHSAAGTLDPASYAQSLAGLLPFRLTRIDNDPIDLDGDSVADPIRLDNFQADITVTGYLDDAPLAGLPFTPVIRVGGVPQGTGPGSTFEVTYRLVDQTLRPWNIGPVTLGIEGAQAGPLTLDGQINLGGYRLGEWDQSLSGLFTVVATGSDAEDDAFQGLEIEILPEASSLSNPLNLFQSGGRLRALGEARLADNFSGSLGGISFAGATLGFEAIVTTTPTVAAPFLEFNASFQLLDISVQEVTVEIENLGTLVAGPIAIDFGARPGEPIGVIGAIDFRPQNNSMLRGLDTVDVQVFDAVLYADRLEMNDVRIVMDGTVSYTGESGTTDLLLVDDLELLFESVVVHGTFDPLPTGTVSASIAGVGVNVDAAILLPDSTDPADVPDLDCEQNGGLVNGLPEAVDGVAVVTCVAGSFDGTTGALSLVADRISAQLFDLLRFEGQGATLTLDPNAQATDVVLGLAGATLTIPLLQKEDVALEVTDLQVTNDGNVSILDATATASGGALSRFGMGGLLPVDVTSVVINRLDGSRVVLNEDSDGDGFPEFDVRATGYFDFTPLEAVGLTPRVSIGGSPQPDDPANPFDVTFRVFDGGVRPWTTSEIVIGLAGGPFAGFSFDGILTSGGYTDGVWDSSLDGSFTASLIGDNGTVYDAANGNLTVDILPGSSLNFNEDEGQLFVNGRITFGGQISGSWGGLSLDGAALGFNLFLDTRFGSRTPFFEVTNFEVIPGELNIDQIQVDIENLVTLTLADILIDPNPAPGTAIGTIGTITADMTNSPPLRDLSIGQVQIIDAKLYADRIELNDIRVFLDGRITDGDGTDPRDLLLVDDLRLLFDAVVIHGSFDPANLAQTIQVNGSVEGITLDLDAAILLPEPGTTVSDVAGVCSNPSDDLPGLAAVCEVRGEYDGVTGNLTLQADRASANLFDALQFDARNVSLAVGDTADPLLEVDEATLSMGWIDQRSVELRVDELVIAQNGELSILEAVVDSQGQGVLTAFGLAGILPLDVTDVRIVRDADQDGVPDGPVVLNVDSTGDGIPDPEFDVTVSGFFDFSPFDAIGLTPSVTIGGEARDEGAANTFETTFRVVDSSVRPWDAAPITLGLAGSPAYGVDLDGSLTLGGYVNGIWQPPVTGSFTGSLVTDLGITADLMINLTSGSSLEFTEDEARLVLVGDATFSGSVSGQSYFGIALENATLDFQLLLDASLTREASFVEFTRFEVTIGNTITIDRFSANLADVFVVTASDITVFTTADQGVIGEVGQLEIDIPATSALFGLSQTSITASDIVLVTDGQPSPTHTLRMGSVTLFVSGTLAAGGTDLLEVNNLKIEFSDVEVVIGDFFGLLNGQTVELNDFGLVASGIQASLASATLLPGSSTVTATVTGLEGAFDANGNLEIELDGASADLFDELFQFDVTPPVAAPDDPAARIRFGPDIPASAPLLEVLGTASVGLSLLDDRTITLGVQGLTIQRDGQVSITGASVGARHSSGTPTGIGQALGLAEGLIPVDVTLIELASNGDPISFNVSNPAAGVSTDSVDITVQGFVDFTVFGDLPFTPVVQIGDKLPVETTDSTFDLTFRVDDIGSGSLPQIRIQQADGITLGIKDFAVGPFELAGADNPSTPDYDPDPYASVMLGGYVNGVWQTDFGVSLGLAWQGDEIDAGGSVAVTGDLSVPGAAGNPNPDAVTLEANVTLTGSFATGSLQLNEATGALEPAGNGEEWGFGFGNLGLALDVQFSMLFDPLDVDNDQIRFEILPVNNRPFVTLDSQGDLSVDQVAAEFGGLLKLEATNAVLDFGAFVVDAHGKFLRTDGPFIRFGGTVPPAYDPADESTWAVNQVDSVDGSLSISFSGEGNPLAGLGGKAGNFGIGFNPEADVLQLESPIDFYQLPDFFVTFSLPEEGGFGFPDWLPVSIREIGLRFPDVFGDLLPSGGPLTDDSGNAVDWIKSGFDTLTNFNLLFSGGLQGSPSGWPITFELEDTEVSVVLLRRYAEKIIEAVADNLQLRNGLNPAQFLVNDPADPSGATQISLANLVNRPVAEGGGALAAINALGPQILTLIADLGEIEDKIQPVEGFGTFPIKVDAINVGIEPFEIGPITIGGGIGFGLVDIDTDNDGVEDSDVLFGRVLGQFAYSDVGIGAEIIVSEHGPILARLFAGVPVPIGTIVGAIAGSVFPGIGTAAGASIGTQTGFIITGFQGGLVFDGQPLPEINEPVEILTNPEVRFPLAVTLDEIRRATESLYYREDTSGQTVATFDPPRNTWESGFTFAASGTLTNINVHGMIGAEVTLGANVAFEELGAQLFGFGTLEVLGQGLVDVGILFDFSDPLNPVLDMAGLLPQAGSLLELVLPVAGEIGIRFDTDGLVAGGLIAAKTFVDNTFSGGAEIISAILGDIARDLEANRLAHVDNPQRTGLTLLNQIVLQGYDPNVQTVDAAFLQQRLRQVFDFDLASVSFNDPSDPNYVDPGDLSGGDFFNTAILAAGELLQSLQGASDQWMLAVRDLLARWDSDPDVVAAFQLLANELQAGGGWTRDLLLTAQNRSESRNRRLTPNDLRIPATTGTLDADSLRRTLNALVDSRGSLADGTLVVLFEDLIARLEAIDATILPSFVTVPPPGGAILATLTGFAEGQILATAQLIDPTLVIDVDNFHPAPFLEPVLFELEKSLSVAKTNIRRQVELAEQVGQVLFNAGNEAFDAFFETINPSLTIDGTIQPQLFGFEIGEPTDSIQVVIDKSQLHIAGDTQVLSRLVALSPIPIPLTDRLSLSVQVPFENLYKDLVLGQFPAIDTDRDWRATFRGTVSLFGLFDLGDVTGLVFPAAPEGQNLPADVDGDGDGIPDDHPLETHVLVINADGDPVDPNPDTSPVGYGPDPLAAAGDRALVLETDFQLMRNNGGILVDGRLTLPHFVTDPFDWFTQLQGLSADLLIDETQDPPGPHKDAEGNPICVDGNGNPQLGSVFACFLADPQGFLNYFVSVGGLIADEDLVSQVQLFVPNVSKQGNAASLYFRGEYGDAPEGSLPTTEKLFGLNLGGWLIEYVDPDDQDLNPNERRLLVTADTPGLDARFEYAGLGTATDPNQPPAFPRVCGEIRLGNLAEDLPSDQFPLLFESITEGLADETDGSGVLQQLSNLGEWIFAAASSPSPIEFDGGGAFRAYTPGFGEGSELQRTGGIEVEANLHIATPFGGIGGELFFGLGPSGAVGSFEGRFVDSNGDPLPGGELLAGQLTPEGLLLIQAGIPEDLLGGDFDIEGDAQLLVNMSNTPQSLLVDGTDYRVEGPGGSVRDKIGAYGVVLYVDGKLNLPLLELTGKFLLDGQPGSLGVFGQGSVQLSDFAGLVAENVAISATVAGGIRSDASGGRFGAFSFQSSGNAGDFLGANAQFNVGFNTSASQQVLRLVNLQVPFVAGGTFGNNVPIPAESFQLFAQGGLDLDGVSFSGTVMAQARYGISAGPALQMDADGRLDISVLGASATSGQPDPLVDASGYVALDGVGGLAAARMDLGSSSPFETFGAFSLNGNFSYEVNTTGSEVNINLAPVRPNTVIDAGPFTRVTSLGSVNFAGAEFGSAMEVELVNLVPSILNVYFNPADFENGNNPNIAFLLNVANGTLRAGVQINIGSNPSSLSGLAVLLDQLGLGSDASDVGAWLNSGAVQSPADITFRAYTPGFSATLPNGGFEVDASAALSSIFGSISGDFSLRATPDGPNPVEQWVGGFNGDAVLSVPPFINVNVASLAGSVNKFGCVAIEPGGVFGERTFQFGMQPGACDPHVTISDAEVDEGDEATLTVRIENLQAWTSNGWNTSDGDLKLFLDVEGDGSVSPSTIQVSASQVTGTEYVATVTVDTSAAADDVVEFGEEVIVRISSIETPERSGPLGFHFDIQIADDTGIVRLRDSGSGGTGAGNLVPPRPQGFAVYYPFQQHGYTQAADGWDGTPSADSPLPASAMGHSLYGPQRPLTAADGLYAAGLPVEGQNPLVGLAVIEPGDSLFLAPLAPAPDLAPGFQFTIYPDQLGGEDAENFVPRRLEFWDRPNANEWWEVYAIVGYDIDNPTADFEPPVQLQLEEIVHIVEEVGGQPSIPGVQQDVVGWRRLRVDIGRALCDFPLMPAAVGGSVAWTCTANPRPITFRLVPMRTTTITSLQPNGNLFQFSPEYSTRNSLTVNRDFSSPLAVRQRAIDNVTVFGGEQTIGGGYLGDDLLFEYMDQQFEFDLGGGGLLEVLPMDPSLVEDGVTDPVPDGFIGVTIIVSGTTLDSDFTMSVTPTDGGSPMPVYVDLVSLDPLGSADFSDVENVGGQMNFNEPVAMTMFNNVMENTTMNYGGDADSEMMVQVGGTMGLPFGLLQGSPSLAAASAVQNSQPVPPSSGVAVNFAGKLSLEADAVLGGTWNLGSAGTVVTRNGDFSASVNLSRGFDTFEIRGDLLSPQFRAGLSTDRGDGDGGAIRVLRSADGSGGNILAGEILVDGNIQLIQAEGDISSPIVAERIETLSTSTTPQSKDRADFSGTVDASSLGLIRVTGGNLTGSVVTRDASDEGLRIHVESDDLGRGGTLNSIRSLHIAGGIAELIADAAIVNLIAGGNVEDVAIGGTLQGFLSAASFGRIAVGGDASATIIARATAGELAGRPALESLTVAGQWNGGSLTSQPGTVVNTVTIGGALSAPFHIDVPIVEAFTVDGVTSSLDLTDVLIVLPESKTGLLDDPSDPLGRQILTIYGTDRGDRIDMTWKRGLIEVRMNHHRLGIFKADQLSRVIASGGAGPDVISVHGAFGLPTILDGGSGNDILQGGHGDDQLVGGPGNDRLFGGPGDDELLGGPGNDRLFGGSGDDLLDGGLGDDLLVVGPGNNILIGGAGSDILIGSDGEERRDPMDVNGDGIVSALGVLVLINAINSPVSGSSIFSDQESISPRYVLDVNGDGEVTPLDVLYLVNHLNRRALFLLEYQQAEAEGPDVASHATSGRPEAGHATSNVAPSVEPVPTADALRTKRSPALNLTKTDSAFSTDEPWYEELVDVIAPDVTSAWRDSL